MHNNKKEYIFEIFFICFGAIGAFGCYLTSFDTFVNVPVFVVASACIIALFFYIYGLKAYRKYDAIIFVIYIIWILFNFSAIKDAFLYSMNIIMNTYMANSEYSFSTFYVDSSQMDIGFSCTYVLILIAVPILATLTRSVRSHHYARAFFVTLPFFFVGALFTLTPQWIFVCILLIFWFTCLCLKRIAKFTNNQDAIAKIGSYTIIILTIFVVGVTFLFPSESYVRDQNVEVLRIKVNTMVQDFIYRQAQSVSDVGEVDLRSAGNRFYTGASQLEVRMEEPKDLYVKTFSAGNYEDKKWKSIDWESFNGFYVDVWWDAFDWMSNTVAIKQYDLPRKEYLDFIGIKDIRAVKDYIPIPYYLEQKNTTFFDSGEKNDAFLLYNKNKTDFSESYSVFKLEKIKEDSNVSFDLSQMDELDRYTNFVYEAYSGITTDVHDLFLKMGVDKNETKSVNQKVEYVREFIQKDTKYTLSPGSTPDDKDFIDYFLNENKEGYCVHYATTATNMLRYMGVPARYTEGFFVPANSFKDGLANVVDRRAHAWVEIFDEEYGWIPVEVTPPASDNPSAGANTNRPATDPKPNNQPTQDPKPTTPNPGETETTTKDSIEINYQLVVSILAPIGAIIAIFLQRKIRIGIRTKKIHQTNRKLAVLWLFDYQQKLLRYGGDTDDRVMMIVKKARFSQHGVSEEEYVYVLAYIENLVLEIEQTLSFLEKVKYQYVSSLH